MGYRIVDTNEHNAEVELFVGDKSYGRFTTKKKAMMFLESIPKDDIVSVEASSTSEIADQKNDEVKPKRQFRRRKVGNDRERTV